MKIVYPKVELMDTIDGEEIIRKIERCGRTCYRSEAKITPESSREFVRKIVANGHESQLEHVSISIRLTCDRGVSHELVRHRIASYSQESTRYVNATGKQYEGGMEVIKPPLPNKEATHLWIDEMERCEQSYIMLMKHGCSPQIARSVLPNSLKTELVVTMNLRAWRNFFKLRCAQSAHPQMREVALMILNEFQKIVPVVFDDLTFKQQ